MRVLFVCTQNRLRSPTAEKIFCDQPGIEVTSAGLGSDANNKLTPELVQWAEIIFLMENSHRNKLLKKFRDQLNGQRIIVLGIPDDYEYMDLELVRILKVRVSRHLNIDPPKG